MQSSATNTSTVHYMRLKTHQNLKNENKARSELTSVTEITSLTFIRKGPRRKEFSQILLVLPSKTSMESLLSLKTLCGSSISLTPISEEEALKIERDSKTKLYVGNLPKSADNIDLWNHFKQFGKLAYSYVITNPKTKKSKGFGFVIFDKRSSVDKALEAKGQRIKGKLITMKMFLNKSQIKREKGVSSGKGKESDSGVSGGEREEFSRVSGFYLTNSNPEIVVQEKLKIPNMEFDKDGDLKAGIVTRELQHQKDFEGGLRFNQRGRPMLGFGFSKNLNYGNGNGWFWRI